MDRLWNIVYKEKIKVLYEDFSNLPRIINGLYLRDKDMGPTIILDEEIRLSHRLHKCVLAHEVGHFYTAPRTNLLTVYTSANLRIMQSQDERKATKWACDFLMPSHEIERALLEGYKSPFDLAEYFDVTEFFVYRKLELMEGFSLGTLCPCGVIL